MKPKYIIKKTSLSLLTILFCANTMAQDSTGRDLNIALRYFLYNNKIPYLLVNTKTKTEGKFQPVNNILLNVYMDSVAPANLVGKTNTNANGDGYLLIPATLKQQWETLPAHKFLAVSVANKEFPEATTDLQVTKAKILVDTTMVDSVRSIKATVLEYSNNDWIPVKDVEMKIGIRRMGGVLPVGKEATYTTDSTGAVTAEFKRDSLPAEKGTLTLVINVEDNDKYGNLVFEEKLPWGVNIERANDWNKRSLWSTRFRTPIWLLFMAYSIMAAVWSVLIFLVVQIIKIKKLGLMANPSA